MGTTSMAPIVRTVERSAIRKVCIRLVPFVALMFFINYLDRTAIGFAGPNGMNEALGLAAAQYGFASGVFFIGYILLEVPSNLALHRFGARRWLARIMVTWGIVAVLFTWVQSFAQLSILRFLLGVAEAGFFPGAILFLSLWVPARYRSRILGLFYLAQPLTTVIGAPLAGWLISQHGVFFGLEGWRFMFLGVGIPAIIVGVIAWFYLADSPAKAKWLTKDEADWLTAELAAENEQQDRPRPPAPQHPVRVHQQPGLDSGHDLLRLHLRPVHAGLLPADDHRRLRGPVRDEVRVRREGSDHGHPVPAGCDRLVLRHPTRHQVRREALRTSSSRRCWVPPAFRWPCSPARRC